MGAGERRAGDYGHGDLVERTSGLKLGHRHPGGATRLAQEGDSQVLAATVRDQHGVPVAGVAASWQIGRVVAGSTSTVTTSTVTTGTVTTGTVTTGTVTTGTGTTDANGTVSMSDPSPSGSALDTVQATAGSLSGSVRLYWVAQASSGTYAKVTVLGTESTSSSSGYIDMDSGGTYLRLLYDPNDILQVTNKGGTRTVQTQHLIESLVPGATLTASPYAASPDQVSTFNIISSSGGGQSGGSTGTGTATGGNGSVS